MKRGLKKLKFAMLHGKTDAVAAQEALSDIRAELDQ